MDPGHEVGGSLIAGHVAEIRPYLVGAQPLERDAGGHPHQPRERLGPLGQLGLALAVGAHDQDRGIGDRLGDEAQHHERPRVGGVQVVEHDDQRSLARRLDEELRDRVEQPEARRLGIDGLGRGARELLEVAAERAYRLDPWPIDRGAALLPAATRGRPPAALGGLSGELLHQAGLADAGLAAQQEESAAPLSRLIEPGAKLHELGGPADERATARSVRYRRARRELVHGHTSLVHAQRRVQLAADLEADLGRRLLDPGLARGHDQAVAARREPAELQREHGAAQADLAGGSDRTRRQRCPRLRCSVMLR